MYSFKNTFFSEFIYCRESWVFAEGNKECRIMHKNNRRRFNCGRHKYKGEKQCGKPFNSSVTNENENVYMIKKDCELKKRGKTEFTVSRNFLMKCFVA